MKRTSIIALLTLALAACGQEEAPTAAQPGASTTEGAAQTPSGAANDMAGNKAPENVTDDVPTQKQLDPKPDSSTPAQ